MDGSGYEAHQICVLGMCMRPIPNPRLSFFGCECMNRPEPVRSKISFLRRDVTVTDRSIVVPFPRRFPPSLFLFLNILLHFSALTRTRILCMKWQRSLNLMFFGPKRCGNGKVTVTSRLRSSDCFDVDFDNDLKKRTK